MKLNSTKIIPNKQKLTYLTAAVITLLTGVLSYYILRDFNMLFFQIFKMKFTYANIRLPDNSFICFLRYNLCDGLWLLSGILFLRFIWFNAPKTGGYYVNIFIGIALLMELLQLTNLFPGTFDIFDIFTMAFFALSEHCINYFFTIKRR